MWVVPQDSGFCKLRHIQYFGIFEHSKHIVVHLEYKNLA